ncbi:polyubiquitin-like [Odontesthes bonariensis]|uniref:polyubiquitin-like n=1 Tax=Odontesthes bonariensis TaxID=219752 RepID=UPI003F5810DE
MELTIIMLDGTSHCLKVQPYDTVGSLKMYIQNKLGHTAQGQKLVFDNGRRTPLDDDSRPLSSYGLQSGSRVSLLVTQPARPATIQVFLKNEKGVTTTYDIRPDETVANFKTKVHKREGVPESQQRLIHEGQEMMSGKLSDFNVREMSTIYLTFRLRGG